MRLPYWIAPAHNLRGCAGAFISALLITGCERGSAPDDQGPRTLELESDTIQIESGVRLYDVKVLSTQTGDFAPTALNARAGDIVRFTAADNRTHGIVLAPPTPEARTILEAADQLRSPPLVARGQAWVISLSQLPPGVYTISCISHAGTARLTVQ